MRMSQFRIAALLIAAIVVHDAWMATAGHDALAAPPASAEHGGDGHRHHVSAAPEGANPDTNHVLEHCGPLRVAAPLNRDMTPALDTAPVGAMPESTGLTRFASTSRTFIEMPPPHPPDLIRAFFQVYLI